MQKNSQWCCSENRSKEGDDNFIPPSSPLSRLSAGKCKLSTKPNKKKEPLRFGNFVNHSATKISTEKMGLGKNGYVQDQFSKPEE